MDELTGLGVQAKQVRGEVGMTFDDILEQALDMLQRRGRVSYRALKRQFTLDDDYLADLKAEILYTACDNHRNENLR